MKIYLASSFDNIDNVNNIAYALEQNGHKITEKWWKRAYQSEGLGLIKTTDLKKKYDGLSPNEFYNKPECEASYYKDFFGVKDSDIFILVAGDIPQKFNGANIELGIALSDEKPCFSIGNLENSVLYFKVIKTRSLFELIREIEKLKRSSVSEGEVLAGG